MEATVEPSVKIGSIKFNYALSEALEDRKELRAEAIAAWLYAEWKREQEKEASA